MDPEKEQNVLIDLGIPSENSQPAQPPPSTTRTAASDELAQKTQELELNEKQPLEDEAQPQVNKEKEKERVRSPTPPPPPPKDDKFLRRQYAQDDELANIMDEMDDDVADPALQKIMSPRLDMSSLPMRTSSLDPSPSPSTMTSPKLQRQQSRDSYMFSPAAARPGSISGVSIQQPERTDSPRPASSIFQPPPPSPDPEPVLPFDFHRFLEQLRHRTADPVARFLRSFLNEFGKKQWAVHEQVKIISDFLEFISKKMAQCEVWRTVSDAEFDNAREGMEKLVMNRLYSQTFSPAIPAQEVSSPTKKRFRHQTHSPHGPGRRGQHQEDVERDEVIAQKIRIYGWIREEHLDIAPITDKGRRFLVLAQQELLKIGSYRAPRDKVICILNTCKVIFGYLKNNKSDQSADSFVPLLIYTVLRANPENLVSNVQYILRFRNQDKLGGEAGYYISSLMGVVTFIENLDRTNLTITDEEFEKNVEAAVSQIAEGHKADEYEASTHDKATSSSSHSTHPQFNEKSTLSRPEVNTRNSTEGERTPLNRGNSTRSKNSAGEPEDDNAAVTGLLRTIQKPLSTIGRMFSDEGQSSSSSPQQLATPQPISTPRLSPGLPALPQQRKSAEDTRRLRSPERREVDRARSFESSRGRSSQDSAARQASNDMAEAQRIQAQEHQVVVETLQGMFPDLDREVISDVVRMKEGRVGSAVDACLALNN
ncbi:hypothetical protein D6D15_06603 [Aureobasidium pullulans]|uniref:VPS9 domain-containing protein n=1 Tax=Aureobasidium pullulans TaxID=5580 RepID=A0A4S9B4D6_AURPU|nr:hypothetical protein D6D15_06603 [Aureobasidium pullulans]